MKLTRKDLSAAAPGIYIVKCEHPRDALDTDPVIEGPLPGDTREQQEQARSRATVLQLRGGARTAVELVQVVAIDPLPT